MRNRQMIGFGFVVVLFFGTLQATPPMLEEEKSDAFSGAPTGSSYRQIAVINRRLTGQLDDTSSSLEDRQGNTVVRVPEDDLTTHTWRDVSSAEPSREGSPITTRMEVLPVRTLEEEIAKSKNMVTALRQQLILKKYQLNFPTSRARASTSVLESIGQFLLPKDTKAQVEEAMTSIMNEVSERMKQQVPDSQYANIRFNDLEKIIDQSEHALRASNRIDPIRAFSLESQTNARRTRLAEINADVQEAIHHLRIQNDPSLAALVMTEVLKEKIEALESKPLFQGTDELLTSENFIQLSMLYHLTERTLFAAEDTFFATAAEALKSPESNESLNERCDQAGRLVLALRTILLTINEIIQTTRSLYLNQKENTPFFQDMGPYLPPVYHLSSSNETINQAIEEQLHKLKAVLNFGTSEISNALSLAQDIHQTLPKETISSNAPLADAEFASLCEKAKKASLDRVQASEVRYYDASLNAEKPAYPHLCKELCRSSLERIKNQSARQTLFSQLELQFSGHQYNHELIPTAERVADIQEMSRLTQRGVNQWEHSRTPLIATSVMTSNSVEYKLKNLRKTVSILNSLFSDASSYLKECSKNLRHDDSPNLIRVFLASKLANIARKKLDEACHLATYGGYIPFSVQEKLPQFYETLKEDLEALDCCWVFSSRLSSVLGRHKLNKIEQALKAISSIKPLENSKDFPHEIRLQEAASSEELAELSIRNIIAWNKIVQPSDLHQKVKAISEALPGMLEIHRFYHTGNLTDITEPWYPKIDSTLKNFFYFMALDRQQIGPGERFFLEDVMRNVHQSNQLIIDAMEAVNNNLSSIDQAHLLNNPPLSTSMATIKEVCKRTYSAAITAMETFASTIDKETTQHSFRTGENHSFLIDRLRAGVRAFQQKMQPVMQQIEAVLEEAREAKSSFDTILQNELA